MAFLRSQFLLSPQSVKAVLGDAAVFECRPPRGSPEPRVSWWKDGVEIPRTRNSNDRIRYLSNGNLEIVDIKKQDNGHYVCQADNAADTKKTHPAILEVLEKPRITVAPENTTTSEGDLVQFKCRAVGNPSPMIFWSRRNSASSRPLPSRAQIVNADTLVINPIAEEDAGTYVCQARNEAGTDTKEALLRVNSKPSFRVTPSPTTVAAQGRTVVVECQARGYPLPAVYWQLPDHASGIQLLLGQSHDNGRIFVADDGSLHIRNLKPSDSGRFTCLAISNLGRAEASTLLEVRQHDSRPAPKIVDSPPRDQLVLPKTHVTLRCRAEGDPQPAIRWNRDGRPLINMRSIELNDRFSISNDGTTLDILEIQPADSGEYSCRAISETGESTATANVRVDSVKGLDWETANFDPRGAPGAPSRPAVLDSGDTVVSLTWTRSPYEGRAPVFSYVVEKLNLDGGIANWEVVDLSVTNDRFTVPNLEPSSSYQFRIRARNSFGFSLPSEPSDPVRTLQLGSVTQGLPTQKPVTFLTVEHVPKHPVFRMLETEVISGTSVRLNWRSLNDYDLVNKFEIKIASLSRGKETVKLVSRSELSLHWYLLNDLTPFSNYRVEITPIFNELDEGRSQHVTFRTMEAPPSKPVQGLTGKRIENGTRIYLQWQEPEMDGQNGIIIGYRAQIFVGSSVFPFFTQIINSTTHAADFHNLRPDETYVVRVTPMNRAGEGPMTEMRINTEGVVSSNSYMAVLANHPAFLPTLLGSVFGIISVLLTVYTVCICRRRSSRYCSTKTSLLTVPVQRADGSRKGQTAFTYIQAPMSRGGVQQIGSATPRMMPRGSLRVNQISERSDSGNSMPLSPNGPDSGTRPLLVYNGPCSGSGNGSAASRTSSCRRPTLGSDSTSAGSGDNYIDNIRPPTGFISPDPRSFQSPKLQPRLGTAYASLRINQQNRNQEQICSVEMARSTIHQDQSLIPSPPNSDDGGTMMDFAQCDNPEYWDNAGTNSEHHLHRQQQQPLLSSNHNHNNLMYPLQNAAIL